MPAKLKTIRVEYDDACGAIDAITLWAINKSAEHDVRLHAGALVNQLTAIESMRPRPFKHHKGAMECRTVADAQALLEGVARAYKAAQSRQPLFLDLARSGAFNAARNLLAYLALPAEARAPAEKQGGTP